MLQAARHLTTTAASSHSLLAQGSKACVTGANGFIALHLVDQLLQSGVSVTAAVRSSDPQKLKALRGMEDKGDLKIVSGCELLEPGSFESAMQDAQVCFHTASPFWMDDRITDPIQQLVRPAQDGTINVLDACMKARSVQRVVVTSSFASVMNVGGYKPWAADFEYCEDHWNESSEPVNDRFPEPVNGHAYRWSKTVAERAAWEFDSGGQFDVSCVLPPMVLGENKQQLRNLDDLNQSSLILYKMLCGDMKHVMPGSVGFVDVHDVAKAHVLAAQNPAAGGQRYLCSGETRTWLHVASTLHDLFPQFSDSIPNACEDGTTEQPCMMLQNRKIRAELAMEFIPLVTTLRAQGEGLIKAGLL